MIAKTRCLILGTFQDELPECTQELYEKRTKDYYAKFTAKD